MEKVINKIKNLKEWKAIIILLQIIFLTVGLSAQNLNIKGKVIDSDGNSLPGTAVFIRGTKVGVTTNNDGDYAISNVPVGSILEYRLVGFVVQTIKVTGDKTTVNVILIEESQSLDEVTVVAFGVQKTESVLASITTVRPSDLKVPSSNLTTALAGRIAGVISYQRSGEPGQDNADFFVRGITTFGNGKANPLILIDGVELSSDDLARLNTDDIASFSVMKDANATALYGARGANGVILITTKEGAEGQAKLSIRFEESFSSPTRNVALADPVTYMLLGNEAVRTRNPLGRIPYPDEKIAKTGNGNPYVYPATDWAKFMLKDVATNQRLNVNISGGGPVARYYIAAAYSKDNGILKADSRNKFNNNIDLKKYLLRSNININVTSSTELIVRLHGTFDDYTGPIDGGSGVYNKIMRTNPVLFPPYYEPDEANRYNKHILFGNYSEGLGSTTFYINPYADMVKGYKDYSKTLLLAQLELKQDLSFILEGLSARGLFNTTRYSYFDIIRNYAPFYYNVGSYDKYTDTYKLAALNERTGSEYINSFSAGNKDVTSTIYYEAALQYDKTFVEEHHVSGLLILTGREELRGNIRNRSNQDDLQLSFPYRNIGLSGRLTYAYQSKYFIEGNFGYNGSERFAQSESFGFFPSIGVGYLMSNESFWEPVKNIVSKLKLKATYGLVGNDAIGDEQDRFFYLSKVDMNNSGRGSSFGTERMYSATGISISRYADTGITWETAYKQNYGIELGLFKKFEFQVDYFKEFRKNILQTRASIPSTMGLQVIPQANIGEAYSSGVDVAADYSQVFNSDTWLTIHGNFTYAHGEYKVYEEPVYLDQPWRSHVGQPLKQEFGLIAERLFVDDEDVRSSPAQLFGEYTAGDIKYKDINIDGQIDDQDFVPVGYPTTPEIIYGAGFSFGFRNFDLSAFFQGSARSSFWINTGTSKDHPSVVPFIDTDTDGNVHSQNALLQAIADSHWSETDRNPHAFWPRLTDHQIDNNTRTSTWFMRDGSFIRLKTLELGYTLPKKLSDKLHIGMLRIYFSGTNLLTFSKFKLWDPEMAGGGLNYPVQRVLNAGININF
jgi:TonB-linked SusC/RagA family outer membrane protein